MKRAYKISENGVDWLACHEEVMLLVLDHATSANTSSIPIGNRKSRYFCRYLSSLMSSLEIVSVQQGFTG